LMNTLTKFDLQVIEDKKDENVAKIVVSWIFCKEIFIKK
jgi:hypothetical protein